MDGYWFASALFQIEPGEDNDINPGRYGRQLARWLQAQLKRHGYPHADVVAEDWGWCVRCNTRPVPVWVGCGNAESMSSAQPGVIIWHCFPVAELPILRRLFRRSDDADALARLDATLASILRCTHGITMVGKP